MRWHVPRGRRLRHFGRYGTLVIWGALLGVGALTVVPSATILLFPAAAVAAQSDIAALVGGIAYGSVRAAVAVISSNKRRATPDSILDGYEPLIQRVASLTPAVALPASLLVVLLALSNALSAVAGAS